MAIREEKLEIKLNEVKEKEEQIIEKLQEQDRLLQEISGLTKEEAKDILMKRLKKRLLWKFLNILKMKKKS